MGLQDFDVARLHVEETRRNCMKESAIRRALAEGKGQGKDQGAPLLGKLLSSLLPRRKPQPINLQMADTHR